MELTVQLDLKVLLAQQGHKEFKGYRVLLVRMELTVQLELKVLLALLGVLLEQRVLRELLVLLVLLELMVQLVLLD